MPPTLHADPAYLAALASLDLPRPAIPDGEPPPNSIAVLPFVNMSGDPGQDVFTDGVTEDIITDLSNVPGFFVIARNSTFSYKGKPTDVRAIARDLCVRFVLEGSARRAGQRIRINAQLIDARQGGNHIWAERFDRDLTDIFAIQDEVTLKVVEAITGKLGGKPNIRYRPADLRAYDLCVRSRTLFAQSKAAAAEARVLLRRAIALDPNYAEAHWRLALSELFGWLHWGEGESELRTAALESARRAVELDANDAGARWVLGFVLLYERQVEAATAHFEASLAMNSNEADAMAIFSDLKVLSGVPAEALALSERALVLNPHPPGWYYWTLGQALVAAGQYEEAVKTLRREETYRSGSRRILAAALGLCGQTEEAREEAAFFAAANPHWRISTWAATQHFRNAGDLHFWMEAYRKIGLPE